MTDIPIQPTASGQTSGDSDSVEAIFNRVEALRPTLTENFRDEIVKSMYAEAETIARRAVHAG